MRGSLPTFGKIFPQDSNIAAGQSGYYVYFYTATGTFINCLSTLGQQYIRNNKLSWSVLQTVAECEYIFFCLSHKAYAAC